MKKHFTTVWTLGALAMLAGAAPSQAQGLMMPTLPALKVRQVRVNDVRLTNAELTQIQRRYQVTVPEGDYWYDKRCGAWGLMGGPTLGFLPAGLNVGGRMRSDVSNGRTGVFVNGRQLPAQDVAALARVGVQALRGRWWLLGNGDFGADGVMLPLGNLVRIARSTLGRPSRARVTWSDAAGGGVMTDGGMMSAIFRDGHGGYLSHNDGQ